MVDDSLVIVAPIVCVLSFFGPFLLLSASCPSSVAITLMGKREMVA